MANKYFQADADQTAHDENSQPHIVINAFVQDGLSSRKTLNEYRRLLELGPSRNLISSAVADAEEELEEHEVNTIWGYPSDLVSLGSEGKAPYQRDIPSTPNFVPYYPTPNGSFNCTNERLSLHSETYQGNRTLDRNNAADIPESHNVRLWITGLPPYCTTSDLLGAIRGIGEVYASHINPPLAINHTSKRVSTYTSAASLTFFTTAAVDKFLAQNAIQPFTVHDYPTKVIRHRIRTRSIPNHGQSRVLIIRGSSKIADPKFLTWLFEARWCIYWDTEYIIFNVGDGSNEILWAFGSFRAQAHAIYLKLKNEFPSQVTVKYAPDPCAELFW
ncbi:hypothetical protein M426DRAFT_17787 [Hypoxylon sp. CI-4A]|nr:hypothetical protein M426DRAFT_17787 [Hypoxylon sp. CI-4A]